nr:MAG TPA: P63C domain protein [Herelleviridae sp.]
MINKIECKGELKLGDFSIPCYVLENGTRVISGRGIQQSLKIVENKNSGTKIGLILNNLTLKPFIFRNLDPAHFEPLECYDGVLKINGYEATVLVDICDGMLEARKHIELTDRQKIIADQCEVLVRSFAKVGIISLVDEATSYQYDRERFELQKILNAYISDEILKWQLTFTDDFYKNIYRLWGLPFVPKYIRNKPSFIGKLTSKYIYELLPQGVVDKIKEKTGKTSKGNWKYKWHQSLTPEIGREHLKKQIIEVTTLMSISKTKEQFDELFQLKYKTVPVQLQSEFEEDVEKDDVTDDFDCAMNKIENTSFEIY